MRRAELEELWLTDGKGRELDSYVDGAGRLGLGIVDGDLYALMHLDLDQAEKLGLFIASYLRLKAGGQ